MFKHHIYTQIYPDPKGSTEIYPDPKGSIEIYADPKGSIYGIYGITWNFEQV